MNSSLETLVVTDVIACPKPRIWYSGTVCGWWDNYLGRIVPSLPSKRPLGRERLF
jgi:hypothetical protein